MTATVNYHSSGDARESGPWTLVIQRRFDKQGGEMRKMLMTSKTYCGNLLWT